MRKILTRKVYKPNLSHLSKWVRYPKSKYSTNLSKSGKYWVNLLRKLLRKTSLMRKIFCVKDQFCVNLSVRSRLRRKPRVFCLTLSVNKQNSSKLTRKAARNVKTRFCTKKNVFFQVSFDQISSQTLISPKTSIKLTTLAPKHVKIKTFSQKSSRF